jgi:hydroxypyruvate isomerase
MPKFCANLTFLFTELPFMERFAAAAKAGFRAVEYMSPYEFPKEQLADALREHKLSQVLFNLPAGDWASGERGIACHPDRVGEFQDGVGKAIEYASALGCSQVNCLAGVCPDAPEERQRAAFVSNLKFAALKLGEAGVRLLIEPINDRVDIPGFYLTRSQQALDIMHEVGSDNLYLQYDIYHMQVMEGDLARTIERVLPQIAHLQLADNPGRHEPGTGEINYPFLFDHLERIGYEGWIGCEYKPAGKTAAGLAWIKPYFDEQPRSA